MNTAADTTTANGTPVTKGNGAAVHSSLIVGYNLATACDGWRTTGAYGSRIRVTTGEVTCKRCLKAVKA